MSDVGSAVELPSGRVEAFSDAVIAVAATILVLELKVPEHGERLGEFLLAQGPTLAAYAVSFLTVLVFWVNHHAFFARVHHVSRSLLFVNGLFLLAITFISFTAAIVGHAIQSGYSQKSAAILYALSLAATSASFTMMWLICQRNPDLLQAAGRADIPRAVRRSLAGPTAYSLAAAAAMLSAPGSLALDAIVAAFFALYVPPRGDASPSKGRTL